MALTPSDPSGLLSELRLLMAQARGRVAQTVNSELVWLYWQIGHRLRTEFLQDGRAEYGQGVVSLVSESLTAEFGRGFERRNLYRMAQFAEVFPDEQIVSALRTQLSWTHLRELISIEDPLKRRFYTEFCCLERWSTRTLKSKMDGLLFERTAVAQRPTSVIDEALAGLESGQLATLDLILCADKNQEQVELLELNEGSIRVATYLTELPPREMLEKKLLESIERARARALGGPEQ